VEILKALEAAGYEIGTIPESSDALMQLLTSGLTNDPEGWGLRTVRQSLSLEDYQLHFQNLPIAVQTGIQNRWGLPNRNRCISVAFNLEMSFGIQPARGYDLDPSLNYHALI
jgi:cobaltochelatase CobN